jgi:hypothetical protein
MSCIITLNDVEYTEEEFAQLIEKEGIRALVPKEGPLSDLGRRIVSRYDIKNKKESISELWARLAIEKRAANTITTDIRNTILKQDVSQDNVNKVYSQYLSSIEEEPETKKYLQLASDLKAIANFAKNPREVYLSQDQVDWELNAGGQLTDYETQERIRYDTYSGMSLTGIAAWSGKQFGYLFDTTPVTTIIDTETGVITDVTSFEFVKIMASNGLDADLHTIDRLMEKAPKYKINSREQPELEKDYVISVDGNILNKFSRKAWDALSQIAETIDTIINLAIDNVKMQKLHLLGITNNNASHFLTMIGLGVPLNEVSKIFKTPSITKISEGYRWTSKSLNKEIKNTWEEMKELNNGSAWTAADFSKALEGYNISKEAVQKVFNFDRDVEKMPFDTLGISTQILDDIYTGRASKETELAMQLILYSSMKKLVPVAQELFDHAQIYSLLKDLPSKKWKLDSVINKIELHTQFENEADQSTAVTAAILESMKESYRENSEEYKFLAQNDREAAERDLDKKLNEFMTNHPELMYTAENIVRTNLVNRVLRRTVSRKVSPGESVMKNSVVLNLPHVRAAYRVAIQLRNILENAFYVYNPTVQKFVKDVVQKTNIFTAFDSLEKIDVVSKELLKFISADLTFKLNNEEFTTSTDSNLEYRSSSGVTVFGKEAWKQQFIESVIDAKSKFPDNLFLAAIETKVVRKTNLNYLQLDANKLSDERYLEQMRQSFLELITSEEYNSEGFDGKNFSRDFFKYAVMADSMFFTKTGFSLIFPGEWGVAFSNAQDARFESLIPLNNFSTDVNLARMKNTFLYQFMRANPELISRKSKPVPADTVEYNGRKVKVYAGTALNDGVEINYDVKFKESYSEDLPRFIRVFDDPIYMLLDTPGSDHSYYIQISSGVNTPSYDFTYEAVNTTLDLDILAKPAERIINLAEVFGSTYTQKKSGVRLVTGQIVAAFDKQGGSPKELVYFEVKSVSEGPMGISYTLEKYYDRETRQYKTKSLVKERFNDATIRSVSEFFGDTRTGVTHILSSVANVRQNLKGKELANSRFITTENVENKIELPFYDIKEELTVEEETKIVDETSRALKAISKKLNVYVQATILEHLVENNPDLAQKISQLLYKHLGFVDKVFEPKTEDPKAKILANNAVKRIQLNVSRLDKNTPPILTEDGSYILPTSRGSQLNKIEIGSMLWSGGGNYYYVKGDKKEKQKTAEGKEITLRVFSLVPFGEQVFSKIEDGIISLEELERIVKEVNNC